MRISILIFLAFSCLSATFHPIYLSLCTIEITDAQQWSATFNLFFDDLEDALQNQEGNRPNLITENLEQNKEPLQKYLSKHFQIKSDEQMTYLISHMERKNDLVSIYIKGNGPWISRPVQITNTLLLELFESQKNIVKIKTSADAQLLYFKKNETVLHFPE